MLPGVVDLHLHSTASDGACTPRELVCLCLQQGLQVIALTDHDTVGGIDEALEEAAGTPLKVIPGVEISTDFAGAELHILGYFIDWQQPQLQQALGHLQHSRLERAYKMAMRLGEIGLPVAWERIQTLAAGGAVGRPHVAQAMVERGYVSSITEAFQRYIGHDRPGYVPRYKLAPEESVQLLLDAGGVPVLAHPFIFTPGGVLEDQLDLKSVLPPLIEAGLQGIEARYSFYPAETTEYLMALARRHGLLTTGGTDFHGRGTLVARPGQVEVPITVVEELEAHSQRKQPRRS